MPEIDAALTFYRDLLGFRITDFMGPPVSLYFIHVNVQVIDGNYERMSGVCPWWDAVKRGSRPI
jgi:catechol 2,3-dioxygenase-like lactoylglutathione lyase family enzyme